MWSTVPVAVGVVVRYAGGSMLSPDDMPWTSVELPVSMDLGHVTEDPVRMVLEQEEDVIKYRSYRPSPVLTAKVQVYIDKLVFAGICRLSYSESSSRLVAETNHQQGQLPRLGTHCWFMPLPRTTTTATGARALPRTQCSSDSTRLCP